MSNTNVSFSRIIGNFFFCLLYMFGASIIFSFAFPAILFLLDKEILDPSDPVFVKIQIVIIILVLVITIAFRKYFYLPIGETILKEKLVEKSYTKTIRETETKQEEVKRPVKKMIYTEKKEVKKQDKNSDELDIQIGREIK